jgi:mRNA-degrading endonuclease RelE of RelBE toxin-antitoxin system
MTTPKLEIVRHPAFEKDLKGLKKRFRTLDEDLEVFIRHSLTPLHVDQLPNDGIVRINGLGLEAPEIYKVKKFACKALKGKGAMSGIRMTYAWIAGSKTVELIEIYYKGDKENEDRERILKLYN